MAKQGVAAVERALKIMSVFEPGDQALSLADIAQRTGYYKSTILRLSATLCRFGFLARLSDGRYRLGAALLKLGSLFKDSFKLDEYIIPALRELTQTTQETATFYIRQEEERVCLFRVDSPQPLREHMLPGQVRPIDNTSAGRVFRMMEAERPPSDSSFPVFTEGILDSLTASCSAPVVASDGRFLGVLSVSGPTARFTMPKRRQAGRNLMKITKKLSGQLGGLFPPGH